MKHPKRYGLPPLFFVWWVPETESGLAERRLQFFVWKKYRFGITVPAAGKKQKTS